MVGLHRFFACLGKHPLEFPALFFTLLVVVARTISREDLTFYDETIYLARALSINAGWLGTTVAPSIIPSPSTLPRWVDGAVYSDLYWILSQVTTNEIGLYFVGRCVAAILLVLAVWIASRILAGPKLAWVAASTLAVSPAPYVWPGVSAPAAGAVVLALALMFRTRQLWTLGVASGLMWLAAGLRPEFVWVAVVMSAIALVSGASSIRRNGIARPGSTKNIMALLVGCLAIPATLVWLHGLPLDSGDRGWLAFSQHFAIRHAAINEDAWLDYAVITDRSFPRADSIVGAVTENPSAVAGHVIANSQLIPRGWIAEVLGITTTSTWLPFSLAMWAVLLAGVIVSLVPRIPGWNGNFWASIRSRLRIHRTPIIATLVVLTAVTIPLLAISPRHHYLLVPTAVLVVGLVAVQQRIGSARWVNVIPVAATVVIFAFFAVDVSRSLITPLSYPPPLTMTATQMNESTATWRLLGVDWGLEVYIQELVQVASLTPQGHKTFLQLLNDERINAVLINDRFLSADWNTVEGFHDFVADPSDYGFTQVVPRSPVWIR